MPGAGTDRTKTWADAPGPVVVLVEPQLGENIGAAARAMANFGLARLRLVKPLQGWPNPRAHVMAAGADRILEQAELFDSVPAAIADCSFVAATTARAHDQAKPVIGPDEAARRLAPQIDAGATAAILFGRERNGLENDEVGLADVIVTLPVNPAFASLNLAQAVLILAYEWRRHVGGGALPFSMPEKSPPAPRQQLLAFFDSLERELERIEYFRPAEKRETMTVNMRNIFTRMQPTQQDIRTLHGIVTALVEGRKGPARGGVLDGEQAELLRHLLAERGGGQEAGARSPARGLARLLRRNPTEGERRLWNAMTSDRRFATLGFKRQTPVGPHIPDFVSFAQRAAIDLIPEVESAEAAAGRAARRRWLEARGYRVMQLRIADLDADPASAFDAVAAFAGAAI